MEFYKHSSKQLTHPHMMVEFKDTTSNMNRIWLLQQRKMTNTLQLQIKQLKNHNLEFTWTWIVLEELDSLVGSHIAAEQQYHSTLEQDQVPCSEAL